MKAEVGDRIVVASGTLHRPIRDGEILQIGEGGAGPYLVRWSDGSESLFFPGPDAHVEHVQRESEDGADQQAGAEKSRPQPTKSHSGRMTIIQPMFSSVTRKPRTPRFSAWIFPGRRPATPPPSSPV